MVNRIERPDWLPASGKCKVQDITIRAGDRVQLVGEVDSWLVVESIIDEQVILRNIPHANGSAVVYTGVAISVTINQIYAHQINGREDDMKVSPEENLRKCRETLAKVTKNGADPRVIGLWKAKVAQAEKLCMDTVREDKPKTATVSSKPEMPRPKTVREVAVGVDVRACLCGCGGPASAGKNFLPGHDARFAGYIRKLDKGVLKMEELPEVVQGLVSRDAEVVQRVRGHNKPKA